MAAPATAQPSATDAPPTPAASAAPGAPPLQASGPPSATTVPPASPWEEGVSEADRRSAEALFATGNERFGDNDFGRALEAYAAAVRAWQHPSIQFNMAVCQIELGDHVGAWASLQGALRFGQGPLSDRNHSAALRYQKLLRSSLAFVTVRCDEEGAQVTLDGQPLLVGPGAVERTLSAGAHILVASKPGLVTTTRPIDAAAGREAEITLTLAPVTVAQTVYPMDPAIPWSVLGGSLAVALSGLPLWLTARATYARHDDAFAQECPAGCATQEIPAHIGRLGARADRELGGAIALFVLGGAAAATGIALLIYNQPETMDAPATAHTGATRAAPDVTFAPTLGGAWLEVAF